MSFGIDYPVLTTGSAYTSIDLYGSSLNAQNVGANPANGAYNTPGAIYSVQPSVGSLSTNGIGSQRFVKYVRYNPTASVAMVAGPAPVYWKDSTYTVVTPTLSEALGANANSFAGWLLPNTTSFAGLTAAQLNGNFCFIHVGGFLPACIAPAGTAIGDAIIGAAGSFTGARVAAGTAPTNLVAGWARSAIAGGLADIYTPLLT